MGMVVHFGIGRFGTGRGKYCSYRIFLNIFLKFLIPDSLSLSIVTPFFARDHLRLPKIVWENRFRDNIGNVCLVSVDGTDFRIQEPTPFWKGWHSRKFNASGLRYEVAISIRSGDVVWIHGPFPCGSWPDITIFRNALKYELNDGEKVEADKGYRGEPECVCVPNHNVFLNRVGRRQKTLVRARHETLNKRLKQWRCLHDTFRHDLVKHGPVFRAVAVIVQVSLENGEPLFSVPYDDNEHYSC